eukprot:PhF_6_TR37736/c0_g1_i1/m.56184
MYTVVLLITFAVLVAHGHMPTAPVPKEPKDLDPVPLDLRADLTSHIFRGTITRIDTKEFEEHKGLPNHFIKAHSRLQVKVTRLGKNGGEDWEHGHHVQLRVGDTVAVLVWYFTKTEPGFRGVSGVRPSSPLESGKEFTFWCRLADDNRGVFRWSFPHEEDKGTHHFTTILPNGLTDPSE